MNKVWFVTGSAQGLGRHIVESALARGDMVAATARDIAPLSALRSQYGDKVLLLTLDVVNEEAVKKSVATAISHFGKIDVLVNNAGYGQLMPFEQMSSSSFRDQMEVNLMGTVNATRAVLPHMRAARAGHIFQISSIGGRIGSPGLAAYQAAKWAVGGFSEVVSAEVSSLGIKVCVIEPGGMRTSWAKRANAPSTPVLADYASTVGQMQSLLGQYAGQETGSPEKVAAVICRLADHPHPPARLMLGSDAIQYVPPVEKARAEMDKLWEKVTCSTDVTATGIEDFPSN